MERIDIAIESLIFVSNEPVSVDEILNTLQETFEEEEITKEMILENIEKLIKKYKRKDYSFEVIKSGEGYSFLTKKETSNVVNTFLKNRSKKRLSRSALETLSIIAYKQPITKGEIEKIRGVGSDYAMKKLLNRGLVKMKGKSEAIGRPMLYGTTDQFLEYFGITTLRDLPSPKEFSEEDLGDGPDDVQPTTEEPSNS
ncbi:SMC-Scp complex subunit ScpB [Flammeovirga sp. EKP202]|uniref:SMC-Scp complex subunit ScpB n=1 Tax=Flammeovirga sp. EKP202 TaxID=2770592 RepID=UPI00165F7BCF|nr:SMC-Scp complex subunit ScpB [Flammeovirga sp. EKP202]MBD0402198.1 SMC-Scp complex subunit ScpB [Flammeovirga sp. EKP202]